MTLDTEIRVAKHFCVFLKLAKKTIRKLRIYLLRAFKTILTCLDTSHKLGKMARLSKKAQVLRESTYRQKVRGFKLKEIEIIVDPSLSFSDAMIFAYF